MKKGDYKREDLDPFSPGQGQAILLHPQAGKIDQTAREIKRRWKLKNEDLSTALKAVTDKQPSRLSKIFPDMSGKETLELSDYLNKIDMLRKEKKP